MLERSARMDFAPSTWVFPGGRVDPLDAQLPLAGDLDGHVERVGTILDEPADAVRTWLVAAARELFEEAGVLLVTDENGDFVDTSSPAWAQARGRLEAHEATWADLIDAARLRLDLLTPVDRWITPEFERRRYDTIFFLAALPDGARAEAVTREAQQGRWVQPQEMLDAADRGEVQLLPPTRTRLRSLVAAGDLTSALRSAGPVRPTRPWPVAGPDGPFLRAVVNP